MPVCHYSNNKSVQILIYLLKYHGVKKIVVSPGTTNVEFVASIQDDEFFEIISSVDERSAAYIACGMAQESGEPVALSCTGATASRNYLSGLTEAYYRQLPILAITSTQHSGRIGNYIPQVIDRTNTINDTCLLSVDIPEIHNEEDEWSVNLKINKALLQLKKNGGGPVHINLQSTYSRVYSVTNLPETRVIDRVTAFDPFPEIKTSKVAIFVGAHVKWSEKLTEDVDCFCRNYNGVVLTDHTGNYQGDFGVDASLICCQDSYRATCRNIDLLIHIGNVSGAYMNVVPKEVWRVNPDGEARDTFRKLRYIFEMPEEHFFEHYNRLKSADDNLQDNIENHTSYLNEWKSEREKIDDQMPELPFSNGWIAQQTIGKLPQPSILYLGILNSLRMWGFFHLPKDIECYSNTGGFGIDGILSSAVGTSLIHPDRLVFCVLGDLSFFYDMNALGNRFVGKNLRILVVNNGKGTEFTNYNHPGAAFGEETNNYIAAAGHYGNKSPVLLKHYTEDLGFEYLAASTKEEYLNNAERFVNPAIGDKSILFEAFTDSKDESDALKIMHNLEKNAEGAAKHAIIGILGDKNVMAIRKILKK